MARTIKTTFNAGKLSATLDGRIDIAKYYNGCSEGINAIPMAHGGTTKRPGTEFIAKAKGQCRLFPFEFSVSDVLVLEFSDAAIRFYKNSNRVMTASASLSASAVSITAFADYGGGSVKATAAAHGLLTGDRVTIAGTTSYNGLFSITKIDANEFYFTDTWVANDATGTVTLDGVYRPSAAVVQIGAPGHGYSTGAVVRFSNVGGTTQLNYNGNQATEWTITVVNTNSFTLNGTNGDNFTAYTSEGTVAGIYTLTSPYAVADLFEIHFIQSADVIYLVHSDYPPQSLSRLADNNWTITDTVLIGGPFLTENTDAADTLKITGSTHTGANNAAVLTDSTQAWTINALIGYTVYNITDSSSVVITANTATTITGVLAGGTDNDWDTGDVYVVIKNGYYIPAGMKHLTLTATGHTPFLGTANDVGTRWQLRHTRADNVLSTEDNQTNAVPTGTGIRIKGSLSFEVTIGTSSIFKVWRKAGNGNWQEFRSFTANTSYTAEEDEDAVYFTFTKNNANGSAILTAKDQTWEGIAKITTQTSTTVAIITAETDLYYVGGQDVVSSETSLWSEGAFGEYRGYPRAITLHENRLWLAGTTANPQMIWGSKSSGLRNFTVGSLDDDSIQNTIEDSDVSQIQWMASEEVLLVGTAKKEYRLSASNSDDPMTPDDCRSKLQSSHGSYWIQPVQLNNAIFYFQGNGQKLRLMRFMDTSLRYESDDGTMLSTDIFENLPVQMMAQRIPESVLWIIRADGSIAMFTYEPKEDVAAWSEMMTGGLLLSPVGKFTSLAIVRGSVEDDSYASVRRVINNETVYYIEKFYPRLFEQTDESLYLDCAKIVVSTNASQNIVFASDTILYGAGTYGSSFYGGTV